MADEQNPFPSPQPGDSEDVELALETAQRLYRTGDHVEALKWLRRAVNAADEAGDDRRQLELARAAADYTAFAATRPSEVAPVDVASESYAPTAPTPSRLPQPQKAPPPPSARLSTVPPSPAQSASVLPTKAVTVGGPPPLKARPASVSPGIPPAPKAVSVASLTPRPSPVTQSRAPLPVTEAVLRPSVTSAPASVRPPASVAPSVAAERPKAQPSGPPSGLHELAALPKGSLRVAVRVSARDETLYVVRPLSPGARVPVGAREAWLFFDEAGTEDSTSALPSRG